MKRSYIITILLILVCLGLGWLLGGKILKRPTPPDPIFIQRIDTVEDVRKIDSLQSIIRESEAIIEILRSEIGNTEIQVIERIDTIKTLPPTENLALLEDALGNYGECTNIAVDSFPVLLETPEGLELAALSMDNLKDINIIVAKYEGEVEINSYLNDIIREDSLIQSNQKEIIATKDTIIEKQRTHERSLKRVFLLTEAGTIVTALLIILL